MGGQTARQPLRMAKCLPTTTLAGSGASAPGELRTSGGSSDRDLSAGMNAMNKRKPTTSAKVPKKAADNNQEESHNNHEEDKERHERRKRRRGPHRRNTGDGDPRLSLSA